MSCSRCQIRIHSRDLFSSGSRFRYDIDIGPLLGVNDGNHKLQFILCVRCGDASPCASDCATPFSLGSMVLFTTAYILAIYIPLYSVVTRRHTVHSTINRLYIYPSIAWRPLATRRYSKRRHAINPVYPAPKNVLHQKK
ncbi:hypothetical protein EVAR_14127_1 [Eumeta japonica]|uniref:Uncharacterized protein n=1 Tax=Eumeta variegata TaxID=151549 RepID=A0A4C1UFV3_EUMVA|nr:hypothetical protein EVAR_14127_1 [Eumeta japonica]